MVGVTHLGLLTVAAEILVSITLSLKFAQAAALETSVWQAVSVRLGGRGYWYPGYRLRSQHCVSGALVSV